MVFGEQGRGSLVQSCLCVGVMCPKIGHDVAGKKELFVFITPAFCCHSAVCNWVYESLQINLRPVAIARLNGHHSG